MKRSLALALLAVCGLAAGAAAQTSEAERRSTAEGVFTEEQADRGERIVLEVCAACHGTEYFTGSFMASWNGARVSTLYDILRASMPEDNPGGLSRGEYADVLAYIFRLNGLPTGDEALGSTKSALERIVIEWSP